jgi:flagellar hook assembly protein FlgD
VPMAYPNPFNAEVVLRYHVAAEGRVRVVVYDALGAQIRVLLNQWQGAGLRTMLWDARDQGGAEAASGIYLLVVEVGGERRARKVMLIR